MTQEVESSENTSEKHTILIIKKTICTTFIKTKNKYFETRRDLVVSFIRKYDPIDKFFCRMMMGTIVMVNFK